MSDYSSLNSVEDFLNHPDCYKGTEETRTYVKEQSEKIGDNKVPAYYVHNLGAKSFVSDYYFKVDCLDFHVFVMETKGATAPDYVGDVDDFSDPRLAHITHVHHDRHDYFTGPTLESLAFKAGDCDGAFNKNIGDAHLLIWDFNSVFGGEMSSYATTDMLTKPYDVYGVAHKLFKTREAAQAYCTWAKHDLGSISRQVQVDEDCDRMDSYFDIREYDDYPAGRDDLYAGHDDR